ncbi:hypothetical protein DFJ74DRAFT_663337 [Hyaloraphidium curvatum]|nr:hypothetical protein DFJ74DRAFT_663337 [Hyaloraphidium curvatum]
MAPSCIGSLLRGFLGSLNFSVVAMGLAVVGLGAAALAGYLPIVRDWNMYVTIAFMVLGGLSTFLAGMCLYGLIARSKPAIWIYAIVVIVLIGGELALAILATQYRETFDKAGELIWSLLGVDLQSLIGWALQCADYTTCTQVGRARCPQQESTVTVCLHRPSLPLRASSLRLCTLFSLRGSESALGPAPSLTRPSTSLLGLEVLCDGPPRPIVYPNQPAPPPKPYLQDAQATQGPSRGVVIEETRRYVM